MSESETITLAERVETQFGEKIALKSPFSAKNHIKFAPWGDGDDPNYDELDDDQETPDFDFSEYFGAHASWNSDALDGQGAWEVDADSIDELVEYFESVGYTIEDETGLAQYA